MRRIGAAATLLIALSTAASAECVAVKYRNGACVELGRFACSDTSRSSFVRQVCYDKRNTYMLIKLQNTWYHYCSIPEQVVSSLTVAESVARFYNAQVKGNFDFRVNPVPTY